MEGDICSSVALNYLDLNMQHVIQQGLAAADEHA